MNACSLELIVTSCFRNLHGEVAGITIFSRALSAAEVKEVMTSTPLKGRQE